MSRMRYRAFEVSVSYNHVPERHGENGYFRVIITGSDHPPVVPTCSATRRLNHDGDDGGPPRGRLKTMPLGSSKDQAPGASVY